MDLVRGKFYEALIQRLVEWSSHEFELDRPAKGTSVSIRSMLEEALKVAPNPTFENQLRNPVEFPNGLRYLWGWFLELCHTGRCYLEGGVALPLSSTEIWAWCQLNEIRLFPWERRAIRLLDVAWVKAHSARES